MRRARRYALNLLLLLFSTAIGIAVVEAYVTRFVWYGASLVDTDTPFARRQSPNATFSYQGAVFTHDCRHNSDGFRERELPRSADPGKKRVVFIGDSLTYGWGVNNAHSFVRRTEALLQKDDGEKQWEVWNLAVFGTHLLHHRDTLFTYGRQIKPDVVVVCLYLPNDVVSFYWPPKRDRRPTPFRQNLKRAYPEHTIQLFKNIYQFRKSHPGQDWQTAPEDNPLERLVESDDAQIQEKLARLDPGLRQMSLDWELNPNYAVYATRDPDMLAYQIELNNDTIRHPGCRRALEEMNEEVKTWGGELRLMLIPMGWTVEPGMWPGFEKYGYVMRPELLNEHRTLDSFEHFADELGIKCLSLRPFFQKQFARCYLDLDGHFTVFGNRQAAHLLAPWIQGKLKPETNAPPAAMPQMQEVQRWDFDQPEAAWAAGDDATTECSNGLLTMKHTKPNAALVNSGATLDCSAVNRIRVRMKADKGEFAQFCWGPERDPKTGKDVFAEQRAVVFPILADNAFHDYDVPLDTAVADFSGSWQTLQLLPAAMDKLAGDTKGATVVIDSIILGRCEPVGDPPNLWTCAHPVETH